MTSEVIASQFGEMRTISTAGGGTSLSTTAAFITLIPGTNWLSLTPRNLSTAVVAKFALNPYMAVLKTSDSLAAASNLTDASEAVQDQGVLSTTALTLNSLDVASNGDFIYIGAHKQLRGVRVTIGNANGTASVLTVKYRKSDDTWADITATDGTDSGGATFAQTGNVTWTVPTDWIKRPLSSLAAGGIGDTSLQAPSILAMPLYWTRWEVSVQLDSSVTVTEMQSMNRNTAQYGEILSGQPLEMSVHRGVNGIGCVEALTDAGTGNLIVNAASRGSGGGFA